MNQCDEVCTPKRNSQVRAAVTVIKSGETVKPNLMCPPSEISVIRKRFSFVLGRSFAQFLAPFRSVSAPPVGFANIFHMRFVGVRIDGRLGSGIRSISPQRVPVAAAAALEYRIHSSADDDDAAASGVLWI